MENPLTWTRAERVVQSVLTRDAEMEALPLEQRPIGLSLTRRITDALRATNLLVIEPDEDGKCNVHGIVLDFAGCPECDGEVP